MHRFNALFVVIIVACVGTYLLVASHADTPATTFSIHADSGTIASSAVKQTCNGASDNSCVTFGGPAVPMDNTVSGDSVGLALAGSGTPFAADSFWNTLLPDSAGTGLTANPNSTAYVNDIIFQLCHQADQVAADPCGANNENGTLNAAHYSVPFYVVPANQPLVPVVLNSAGSGSSTLGTELAQGVPMPTDAIPAYGTDAHMAIYQPSSNTLWELWRGSTPANNAPGAGSLPWSGMNNVAAVPSYGDNKWHAVWGGVLTDVSQSDGVFPYPYAGWTTGLSLLGSIVRIDELQAGQINHVMAIGLGNLLSHNVIPVNSCPDVPPTNPATGTNAGISYPANRSDGTNNDPCAIPEGLRLRLPPASSFNLVTYNQQHPMTPVAYAIAVAAQKYGFVVALTSDGNVGIDLGDPTPYINAGLPNPYTSGVGVGGVNNGNKGLYAGVGGANQNATLMLNFPWSDLVALPFNYGQPD